MNPLVHAKNSAKRWGGSPLDYIAVHEEMDGTSVAHGSIRHRAIYHNSWGILQMEKIFGRSITNSDGKVVCVRDIAREHVKEDLGRVPSLDDWLNSIPFEPWMTGAPRYREVFSTLTDNDQRNKDSKDTNERQIQ